ncbi:glycosyltransferase family 2 protein [bacterium]|nr:glycosyltransferase family 2 protein [bacterium]
MDYNLVIPVFNRLSSLQRLIQSLENSHPTGKLNLLISQDGGGSEEVKNYALNLNWEMGNYEFREQQENLGVDEHNIYCIGLAEEFGHVLVLEDDLTVAPYFTHYLDALREIDPPQNIAGYALYRYPWVESHRFAFELIPNDESVYYQQRPCSKGCFYTADMALEYSEFLAQFDFDFDAWHLPPNVKKWGDEVWEKSYYCFLISENKHLAFPRFSLSTDWGDPGVHMNKEQERYVHQSALFQGKEFYPKPFVETVNRYDAFYELEPEAFKELVPSLSEYQFELDLRGTKDLEKVGADLLISRRTCNKLQKSWGRRLKPELLNIVNDLEGDFYSLGKTVDFDDEDGLDELKEDFLYYYPDTKLTDLLKMKWEEVKSRFI